MLYSFTKTFPRFSQAVHEAADISTDLANSDLRMFACDSLEEIRWSEETLPWRRSLSDVLIEDENESLSFFRFIPGFSLNWLLVKAVNGKFQAFYYAWNSSLDTTNWDLLAENGWRECSVDEKDPLFPINKDPELQLGCSFEFYGDPDDLDSYMVSYGYSPLGDALAINAHPERSGEVLTAVRLGQEEELELPDGLSRHGREYCRLCWRRYQYGLTKLATFCEEMLNSKK